MKNLKNGALRLSLLGGLVAGALAMAPGAANAAVGEAQVTRNGAIVNITPGQITRNDNLTVVRVSGEFAVQGAVRAGQGCTQLNGNTVKCGTGVTGIGVNLGGGNDRFSSLMEISGVVNGGTGNDEFLGARSQRGTGLTYVGGTGTDTVDYGSTGTGVTVTKADPRLDGRPGVDRDTVSSDVEIIRGTSGADTLIGNTGADTLIGLAGADRLTGNGGRDTLDARDPLGTQDTLIDCGTDIDTAIIDAADNGRTIGCETITRP